MELHLLPINAFLSMCIRDDGWPSPLADAGFAFRGLEIPVREEETIRLDGVAMHVETGYLLVAEGKSGRNLDPRQVRILRHF
jgi:hypothetical protein